MPFRRIMLATKNDFSRSSPGNSCWIVYPHVSQSQLIQERYAPSEKEGLHSLLTFIEAVTNQLEKSFRDDSRKNRSLQDEIVGVPRNRFPHLPDHSIQFTLCYFVTIIESTFVVPHQHMRRMPMINYAEPVLLDVRST